MSQASQLSLFDAPQALDTFAVRVSPRARRLTVRVHVGGRVEVIVPRGVKPQMVRAFVQRSAEWIDRKVLELGKIRTLEPSLPASVDFTATSEAFAVDWRAGATPMGVEQRSGALIVHASSLAELHVQLQAWLREAARKRLVPQLLGVANELGLKVLRVDIRRQRTRWGSCSSHGVVSLNCALLFMPPGVVRYLMIHELAHLRHMNHSSAFWSLVESWEPAARQLDRQLMAGWRAIPEWVFK